MCLFVLKKKERLCCLPFQEQTPRFNCCSLCKLKKIKKIFSAFLNSSSLFSIFLPSAPSYIRVFLRLALSSHFFSYLNGCSCLMFYNLMLQHLLLFVILHRLTSKLLLLYPPSFSILLWVLRYLRILSCPYLV